MQLKSNKKTIQKTFLQTVKTNNGSFYINPQDLIGNYILNTGVWEPHLEYLYNEFIEKNDTIIDAGANLGYHSVKFGFKASKVYSFEPQTEVYNLLCKNITLNGLNNVITPYKKGLGNIFEKQQLWNPKHEEWPGNGVINWGGRGIIDNTHSDKRYHSTNNSFIEEDVIDVIPLDSLNIEKCDLLKVDIQGYELQFFKGGKKLIENSLPVIFLESCPEYRKQDIELLQYLKDLNYKIYRSQIGNKDDFVLINPNNDRFEDHQDLIHMSSLKYPIEEYEG